jgi:hypothetical protein
LFVDKTRRAKKKVRRPSSHFPEVANGFFSGERAASASAANGSAACRAGTGAGDDRDPEALPRELEPGTIGAPAWLYRASKSGFDTALVALPDPGGVAGTAPNPAPPGLGAANGFVDAGGLAAAAAANGSCTANGFEEGPGPGELAAAAAANGSCACC